MSSASGTLASRIRLKNNKVGIGEADPIYPLHLTTSLTGQALQLQCDADDAASGANLMLYHRRGASGAGQDNDVISTIFYRGKNDAGTPEEVDYAAIESVISDASDGTEDGQLNFQIMNAGTLSTVLSLDSTGITASDPDGDAVFNIKAFESGSAALFLIADEGDDNGDSWQIKNSQQDNGLRLKNNVSGTHVDIWKLETSGDVTQTGNLIVNNSSGIKIATATTQKLGFFNSTPVVQQSAIANITATASSGSLPTANGSITIANAASATTTELLEFCVELESKLESALAVLRTFGFIAT